MGDDDEPGAGPGVHPGEVLGEPRDPLDVEVVGGLVEQQQVGRGDEQGREGDPAPLATGERPHEGTQSAHHGCVEATEEPGQHVADPGVRGPLVLGEVTEHRLGHGAPGIEGVVLGEQARGQAAGARHPAVVDGEVAGQHPHQGGLAAPVAPDDADPVPAADAQRDGVEHLRGAERERRALHGDEVGHRATLPTGGRWHRIRTGAVSRSGAG